MLRIGIISKFVGLLDKHVRFRAHNRKYKFMAINVESKAHSFHIFSLENACQPHKHCFYDTMRRCKVYSMSFWLLYACETKKVLICSWDYKKIYKSWGISGKILYIYVYCVWWSHDGVICCVISNSSMIQKVCWIPHHLMHYSSFDATTQYLDDAN